jgi:hypothetical protein
MWECMTAGQKGVLTHEKNRCPPTSKTRYILSRGLSMANWQQ